jgi:hypothetical protein
MAAERHTLPLTPGNLDRALQGVRNAANKGGWTLELRPAKRTDAQNRTLWDSLGEIAKARPRHNGVAMSAELWKCVFLQALGVEVSFVPTLDGDSMFPLGLRSSKLTKTEFAALLDLISAWAAQQGIHLPALHSEAMAA